MSIENPSSRQLSYIPIIVGSDRSYFSVDASVVTVSVHYNNTIMMMLYVQIPAKGSLPVGVAYSGSHIKGHSAVLLLQSTTHYGRCGQTIALALKGEVTTIRPMVRNTLSLAL